MRKSICLLPLAFGTFGLGMSEFVMMGILPDTAKAMNVSIPAAGNFISMYALGVVFGSILLICFGRAKPLKNIIFTLVSILQLPIYYYQLQEIIIYSVYLGLSQVCLTVLFRSRSNCCRQACRQRKSYSSCSNNGFRDDCCKPYWNTFRYFFKS